ncbi:MAG: hypothetical protein KAJ37_08335, partial [Candidatus Krumholzibacteria bacterium]|nr:hypothetical protein [Candidatus Krumholzibacteria bacterium]
MVRTIGLLAAALFLLVLTGSAVPPQSYADTTQQAVATADAGVNTMADEEKDDGEKDKDKDDG